jgi:hypothetical protein
LVDGLLLGSSPLLICGCYSSSAGSHAFRPGRAAADKKRKQGNYVDRARAACQLELPPLQEHGRSSHVTRPRMLHWRPGYCAVTGDSEELPLSASCTNGTSGSWTLADNEKASWDTALHACALRCHADARGRHGWSAGRAQAEPGLQHIWLRQPLTRGGLRSFPELLREHTKQQ